MPRPCEDSFQGGHGEERQTIQNQQNIKWDHMKLLFL